MSLLLVDTTFCVDGLDTLRNDFEVSLWSYRDRSKPFDGDNKYPEEQRSYNLVQAVAQIRKLARSKFPGQKIPSVSYLADILRRGGALTIRNQDKMASAQIISAFAWSYYGP